MVVCLPMTWLPWQAAGAGLESARGDGGEDLSSSPALCLSLAGAPNWVGVGEVPVGGKAWQAVPLALTGSDEVPMG